MSKAVLLKEFTDAYLELFFRLQVEQWENYSEEAGHDLSVSYRQIYDLCQRYRESNFGGELQAQVARGIILRSLVDCEPRVAELRSEIDLAMSDEASREEAVLDLLHLRQELARRQEHAGYPELVFAVEELSLPAVLALADNYIRRNLPQVRMLMKKHNLRYRHWFTGLASMAEKGQAADASALAASLCRRLGLLEGLSRIKMVYPGPLSGYVAAAHVPRDVRLMVREAGSLNGRRTLFHELGHGLSHSLNEAPGLLRTWAAVADESKAQVMEAVGVEVMCDRQERELYREIMLLENMRVALSFRFEMDLWTNSHGARELFINYFGVLDAEADDAEQWYLDSFRSIDAVYIHNYLLGSLSADNVLAYLQRSFRRDYRTWGRWMKANLFAPGRQSLNLVKFLDFSEKTVD